MYAHLRTIQYECNSERYWWTIHVLTSLLIQTCLCVPVFQCWWQMEVLASLISRKPTHNRTTITHWRNVLKRKNEQENHKNNNNVRSFYEFYVHRKIISTFPSIHKLMDGYKMVILYRFLGRTCLCHLSAVNLMSWTTVNLLARITSLNRQTWLVIYFQLILHTAAEMWPLVDVSWGKTVESVDTMSTTDGKRNKGEFNYNSTWG